MVFTIQPNHYQHFVTEFLLSLFFFYKSIYKANSKHCGNVNTSVCISKQVGHFDLTTTRPFTLPRVSTTP